jgi:hypothetical protein
VWQVTNFRKKDIFNFFLYLPTMCDYLVNDFSLILHQSEFLVKHILCVILRLDDPKCLSSFKVVLIYKIKELVQPKMSLNNREFLIWKERGREWGRKRGGCAGQQAGIFKVRLGLGEIEWIYREIERYIN